MKRIISALLILIMLIPPMVLPASAAESSESVIRINTNKETVSVGDVVTVTVDIENIGECGTINLGLVYDPAYLQQPASTDISYANVRGYFGAITANPAGKIQAQLSEELEGQTAVILAAAHPENCLKVSTGTILEVKFTVLKEAPAPGIPLQLALSLNNLYSDAEMRKTVRVVNTHLATANPTKSVRSVSMAQQPTRTQYVQGQALSLEGGKLLVTYSDLTTEEIALSLAKVTQYDPSKLGSQTVRATYAGKEISFDINTTASTLSSISIGKEPTTIEYVKGTASLDKSGGVLLLHYSGGVIKTLDMTDHSVTLSGYNKDTLGIQTIKVLYQNLEAEYQITVVKKKLKKIDLRTPMVCSTCGLEQSAHDLITAAGGDPSSMDFSARQTYISTAANNVSCLSATCEGKSFTTKMKMVYFVGDNFDVDNAVLFVTYSDNTNEELPMTLDMVDFNSSYATIRTVEICYGSKSMLVRNVSIRKKQATSIEIVQYPNKLEYVVGQSLDPSGGLIKVTYDDGSQETIPMGSDGVETYYLKTLGYQRVTVTYKTKQDYFNIRFVNRAVQSIALPEGTPSTFIQGEAPNYANIALEVTYNDGTKGTRYLNDEGVTVSGYDPDKVGTQLVTITYGDKECIWEVLVLKKEVVRLELAGTPPTTLLEGTELDLSGCTLTATYNDGEVVENIPIEDFEVENAIVGPQTVTITYEEKTVTFPIEVLAKQLTAIAVVGAKTQYLLGDTLDRSVGQLQLIYNNGTRETVPFQTAGIVVEGFTSAAEGEYTLTVRYEGLETTYAVSIHREIQSIVVTPPTKTTYKEGEPLDLAGGSVLVTYYNGNTTTFPLSEGMIEGYDANRVGTYPLTVRVGDATATFDVTILAKVLVGISATPNTIVYNEWEEPDLTQLIIIAEYDNGTREELDPEEVEIHENEDALTIEYQGQTATVQLTAIREAAISIEWAEQPQKTTYVQGEPLLKDGSILVRYNNPQKTEQISLADAAVLLSGNTNDLGVQKIYVTYKELPSISYNINVVELAVDAIEIKGTLPTTLLEGTELDLSGCTLTATYNDESVVEDIKIIDAMIHVNNTEIGQQKVTITYEGKEASFFVEVVEKQLTSIAVVGAKAQYLQGEKLNRSVGQLKLSYNNDTYQMISFQDEEINVEGFTSANVGECALTVRYKGLQTEFEITVAPKQVIGIELAAMPAKMMYRQGVEKFDPAGGKLTVYYNNDTQETVPLSAATLRGFSNLFAGNTRVTATYEGFSVELTVLILAENPFKDVREGEYYEIPVLWAVTKGITTGTSATTFSPDNDCTRAQVVTFLWRAAGEPEPQSAKNPFKDVKAGEYYYNAVLWAVEQGITNGMDATHFAPNATCTRGQVVTFLYRAKGKPAASGKNAFVDVKKGEYYYDAVLWAVKNGITNGMDATHFAPDATCTRGQIVTFLYRAYK